MPKRKLLKEAMENTEKCVEAVRKSDVIFGYAENFVYALPIIKMKRLLLKTKLTKSDILKRIAAQLPLKNKVRLADFVIDNSGTKVETRRQVQDLWRKIDP